MMIQCKKCRKYREIKLHETLWNYLKRRPFCISCGHKNRIVSLGGHAPNWKGGKVIDAEGYVRVWIDGIGYKKEHHIVFEKNNGSIPNGYVIHHKDGDKRNNNINNLECLNKLDHDRLNLSLRKNHFNRRTNHIENLCVV